MLAVGANTIKLLGKDPQPHLCLFSDFDQHVHTSSTRDMVSIYTTLTYDLFSRHMYDMC